MVRPGILLYGVQPDAKSQIELELKRSLTLKAKTVFQKGMLKGKLLATVRPGRLQRIPGSVHFQSDMVTDL